MSATYVIRAIKGNSGRSVRVYTLANLYVAAEDLLADGFTITGASVNGTEAHALYLVLTRDPQTAQRLSQSGQWVTLCMSVVLADDEYVRCHRRAGHRGNCTHTEQSFV